MGSEKILEIIQVDSNGDLVIVRNRTIVEDHGRSLPMWLAHLYGYDGKTWNVQTFVQAVIAQFGDKVAGYNGIILGDVKGDSGVVAFNLVSFA